VMANCFKKLSLCFLLSFWVLLVAAQKAAKNYGHQILLISENDSYTFKIIDRYYTNGLSLRFSKAIKQNDKKKKVLNAEIGQSIFTAYDVRRNHYSRSLDRPYTGFLYAKGGLSYLYKNENIFRWNIIAGVTGEAARGEETQRFIHRFLGFKQPYGWEKQLKSDYGFNIHASYHQHLLQPAGKKFFDAFILSDAIVGTTYTKFQGGVLFRLGALEPSYNSAWWDGRVNKNSNDASEKELFFYFEPSVIMQAYNATIQGGRFNEQEGRFTSEIVPFIYQHKFGGVFAKDKWTTQLGFTFRTKEAKTMFVNEVYGTIAIGYRF